MRPRTRIRGILALLILTTSVMVGSSQALSHSQSDPATPVSDITTEVLGGGQPDATTGLALALVRITFAPGAVAPPHTHPGATIFYIESGELTFGLLDGVATLTPAGGTPDAPSEPEELTAGSEVVLTAGDSVFYQGDAVLDERNDGGEPVVILVSNLRGIDEPAREPAATPAA